MIDINIHHYIHRVDDEGRLARIEEKLATLIANGERQMATVQEAMDALTAEVARNTSVDESAVLLMNGLADQLAALLAAGDPAALVAGIEGIVAKLKTDNDALAAAVVANTPAAPA